MRHGQRRSITARGRRSPTQPRIWDGLRGEVHPPALHCMTLLQGGQNVHLSMLSKVLCVLMRCPYTPCTRHRRTGKLAGSQACISDTGGALVCFPPRLGDGGVGGCVGKHQALFVHPPARILASTPTRLAADGPRKATRLSTEHMGGGRGVGFACSLWGKPPRSASCATDGGKGRGQESKEHGCPLPALQDGCYAFFFSNCILLAHPHAGQHLPGISWARCVYKANFSPHFLSRTNTYLFHLHT